MYDSFDQQTLSQSCYGVSATHVATPRRDTQSSPWLSPVASSISLLMHRNRRPQRGHRNQDVRSVFAITDGRREGGREGGRGGR
jgi:hypothetical protein